MTYYGPRFGFLSDGYRYWSLNTSTIQFNAKTYNLSMKWSDSPTSMGFKCSNMGLIAAVNSTPGVELSFLGLQVRTPSSCLDLLSNKNFMLENYFWFIHRSNRLESPTAYLLKPTTVLDSSPLKSSPTSLSYFFSSASSHTD